MYNKEGAEVYLTVSDFTKGKMGANLSASRNWFHRVLNFMLSTLHLQEKRRQQTKPYSN